MKQSAIVTRALVLKSEYLCLKHLLLWTLLTDTLISLSFTFLLCKMKMISSAESDRDTKRRVVSTRQKFVSLICKRSRGRQLKTDGSSAPQKFPSLGSFYLFLFPCNEPLIPRRPHSLKRLLQHQPSNPYSIQWK